MELFYILGTLIYPICASLFENLDLLSSDSRFLLNDDLNTEDFLIRNYDLMEELLTSFEPRILEPSNSANHSNGVHLCGNIVRLKGNPHRTFLIQSFFEDKGVYAVADEAALKQYNFHSNDLERCPSSQKDEYIWVRSTKFPIVGKRFGLNGVMYDIISVSFENREILIMNVKSGDLYQYCFDEQDKAIFLGKLPSSPPIKKFALETQENFGHPVPTSIDLSSDASNEDMNDEPSINFERNQLVQREDTGHKYIFRKYVKGKCSVTPILQIHQQYNYQCDPLRAVTSFPEEYREWKKTGIVTIDLEMVATPGDTLKASGEHPETLRLFILLSFSVQVGGRCLLTDESGTRYYVFMCRALEPVNFKRPPIKRQYRRARKYSLN